MIKCLGILREPQHSPHRETDDAWILRTVLMDMEHSGFVTRMIRPESLEMETPAAWDLILPMCESYPHLKRLEVTETAKSLINFRKPLFINTPTSILQCYRTRMISALSEHIPEHSLPSEIRRVQDGVSIPPTSFAAPEGWWIKRGDVHSTCDGDVVWVRRWDRIEEVLKDFASREITHFIAQPHLPGDLIKFYGVGPGRWSAWFYHDFPKVRHYSFDSKKLTGIAGRAAAALGLEIFGGDAIVSADGMVTIIDINSWPSFAKVRDEAAQRIAEHLRARLSDSRRARSPETGRVRILKRLL